MVSCTSLTVARCLQESNLFFVALDKVKAYARHARSLPLIISENVQGVRSRHRDPQVC